MQGLTVLESGENGQMLATPLFGDWLFSAAILKVLADIAGLPQFLQIHFHCQKLSP